MGMSKAERHNVTMDAIFTSGVILNHEKWGEYSNDRYEQAKQDLKLLLIKYPKFLKGYANCLR